MSQHTVLTLGYAAGSTPYKTLLLGFSPGESDETQRQFNTSISFINGRAQAIEYDVIDPSDLPDAGVTPETYRIATVTVDQYGRVTGIEAGVLTTADLPAGTGTVTSVAMTVPSFLSVSGSPITASGTLAVSLATQVQKRFFAGPTSGADAAPTFRVIAAADLPASGATAGIYGPFVNISVTDAGTINSISSYTLLSSDVTGALGFTDIARTGQANNFSVAQVMNTGLTVNENGNDSDTRIEGDTDANLVFVDASTDRVGIGTNAPATKLHVAGTARANQLRLTAATTLTIATGAVTATQSAHLIDTEASAASDDLDTISGGTEGDILILRAANSARDVVCKDGTGNLQLAGDFTLDHVNDTILLFFDGTNWLELSRSDNST